MRDEDRTITEDRANGSWRLTFAKTANSFEYGRYLEIVKTIKSCLHGRCPETGKNSKILWTLSIVKRFCPLCCFWIVGTIQF